MWWFRYSSCLWSLKPACFMPSRGCADDARLRRFAHDDESSCKEASVCVGWISTIGSKLTGKKVNGREGWCNLRGVHLFRLASYVPLGLFAVSKLSQNLLAQNVFTWQEIRHKFEAANLPLRGTQLNIDLSRAAELTSYLRPNPDLSTDAVRCSRLASKEFGVLSPILKFLPLSGICTNERTSTSYGVTALKSRPQYRNRPSWIRSAV